jgi:hypothetical protein
MFNEQEFSFDSLTPKEVKVKVGGLRHVLREATEDAVVRWRDSQVSSAKFNEEGKFAGIGAVAGSEPLLVSLCLFQLLDDGNVGPNVAVAVIRSWPARVVKQMFDWVKTASDLDDETEEQLVKTLEKTKAALDKVRKGKIEEQAKNEPGAGTEG